MIVSRKMAMKSDLYTTHLRIDSVKNARYGIAPVTGEGLAFEAVWMQQVRAVCQQCALYVNLTRLDAVMMKSLIPSGSLPRASASEINLKATPSRTSFRMSVRFVREEKLK
jgi:hypothetical protein